MDEKEKEKEKSKDSKIKLEVMGSTSLGFMCDDSPGSRLQAKLDAPLANPMYVSDSPVFILRQRQRAARALVSEHHLTVTCPCQKCTEAALTRVRPDYQPAWPPLGSKAGTLGFKGTPTAGDAALAMTGGGAVSSTATPTPTSPAATSTIGGERRSNSMRRSMLLLPEKAEVSASEQKEAPSMAAAEPRDFVWLLRVAAETAPYTDDVGPDMSYLQGWGKAKEEEECLGLEGSLERELGIRIPDTVILEKAKPLRRYSLDHRGKVLVTKMKTSAELLRVLREFVRRAARPRLPPANGAVGQKGGMQRSKSDGIVGKHTAAASAGAPPQAPPLAEVATLYYNDGTVRLMTATEANNQMMGVSKLPREFWQHIRVLQVPVQSVRMGSHTRYITYNFDGRGSSEGVEPEEPLVRGALPPAPRRRTASTGLLGCSSEASARVAAVPKKINACLAERKKGQAGAGFELVSGQFEFVHDEADGTLWLVNATRLYCRRLQPKQEDTGPEEEEVRYFEEEEFAALMSKQTDYFIGLKKRFGGGPLKEDPTNPGLGSPGLDCPRSPIQLNAQDRLAGIKVPGELYKFYQAEEGMLRYYTEDVKTEVQKDSVKRRTKEMWEKSGGRAVGLTVWFHRWVSVSNVVFASKGPGHRRQRQKPSSPSSKPSSPVGNAARRPPSTQAPRRSSAQA